MSVLWLMEQWKNEREPKAALEDRESRCCVQKRIVIALLVFALKRANVCEHANRLRSRCSELTAIALCCEVLLSIFGPVRHGISPHREVVQTRLRFSFALGLCDRVHFFVVAFDEAPCRVRVPLRNVLMSAIAYFTEDNKTLIDVIKDDAFVCKTRQLRILT